MPETETGKVFPAGAERPKNPEAAPQTQQPNGAEEIVDMAKLMDEQTAMNAQRNTLMQKRDELRKQNESTNEVDTEIVALDARLSDVDNAMRRAKLQAEKMAQVEAEKKAEQEKLAAEKAEREKAEAAANAKESEPSRKALEAEQNKDEKQNGEEKTDPVPKTLAQKLQEAEGIAAKLAVLGEAIAEFWDKFVKQIQSRGSRSLSTLMKIPGLQFASGGFLDSLVRGVPAEMDIAKEMSGKNYEQLPEARRGDDERGAFQIMKAYQAFINEKQTEGLTKANYPFYEFVANDVLADANVGDLPRNAETGNIQSNIKQLSETALVKDYANRPIPQPQATPAQTPTAQPTQTPAQGATAGNQPGGQTPATNSVPSSNG